MKIYNRYYELVSDSGLSDEELADRVSEVEADVAAVISDVGDIQASLTDYVLVAGDTMTGTLYIPVVGIGVTSMTASTLVEIKGTGSSAATTTLLVKNGLNNTSLKITDDGILTLPTQSGTGTRYLTVDSTGVVSNVSLPTNLITGDGVTNRVAIWNGAYTITYNDNFKYISGTADNIDFTGALTIRNTTGNDLLIETYSGINNIFNVWNDSSLELINGVRMATIQTAYNPHIHFSNGVNGSVNILTMGADSDYSYISSKLGVLFEIGDSSFPRKYHFFDDTGMVHLGGSLLTTPTATLEIYGISTSDILHLYKSDLSTLVLTVDDDGYLGLGTSTLTAKFNVKGAGNTSSTINTLLINSDNAELLKVLDNATLTHSNITGVNSTTFTAGVVNYEINTTASTSYLHLQNTSASGRNVIVGQSPVSGLTYKLMVQNSLLVHSSTSAEITVVGNASSTGRYSMSSGGLTIATLNSNLPIIFVVDNIEAGRFDSSRNFVPSATATRNLGSSALVWSNIYGNTLISAAATSLAISSGNNLFINVAGSSNYIQIGNARYLYHPGELQLTTTNAVGGGFWAINQTSALAGNLFMGRVAIHGGNAGAGPTSVGAALQIAPAGGTPTMQGYIIFSEFNGSNSNQIFVGRTTDGSIAMGLNSLACYVYGDKMGVGIDPYNSGTGTFQINAASAGTHSIWITGVKSFSGITERHGIYVNTTVSQIVGGTGISSGIYIADTLGANVSEYAAFRASLSTYSHYGLYITGASSKNYLQGTLGINTTTVSSGYKLDINGNATITGDLRLTTSVTTTWTGVELSNTNTSASTISILFKSGSIVRSINTYPYIAKFGTISSADGGALIEGFGAGISSGGLRLTGATVSDVGVSRVVINSAKHSAGIVATVTDKRAKLITLENNQDEYIRFYADSAANGYGAMQVLSYMVVGSDGIIGTSTVWDSIKFKVVHDSGTLSNNYGAHITAISTTQTHALRATSSGTGTYNRAITGIADGVATTNYASYFVVSGGTSANYAGLFAISGAANSWGISIVNTAAGVTRKAYGLRADVTGDNLENYGSYYLIRGTGTGYGVQSIVNSTGSTNYGFSAVVSGVGTTNYGLYVSTTGATTNYAIYSAAGLNYFAGKVLMGSTNTTGVDTVLYLRHSTVQTGLYSHIHTDNGIAGDLYITGSGSVTYGMKISNTATAVVNYGSHITTSGTGTNYAIRLIATGAGTNYGLHVSASGGATNYAIYSAAGLNYFAENVAIGTTVSSEVSLNIRQQGTSGSVYGQQVVTNGVNSGNNFGQIITVGQASGNNYGSYISSVGAAVGTAFWYGIRILATGTYNVNYGIRLNVINAATNYAIYSEAGLNYLADNTLIGTTTNALATKLVVSGTSYFSGTTYIGGTTAIGTLGQLHVSSSTDVIARFGTTSATGNTGIYLSSYEGSGNNYNTLFISTYGGNVVSTTAGIGNSRLAVITGGAYTSGILFNTTRAASKIYFATIGVEAMRINENQNILIGTTSATGGKLQIRSTAEQLRLEYDALVNATFTVDGTGNLTIGNISNLLLNTKHVYTTSRTLITANHTLVSTDNILAIDTSTLAIVITLPLAASVKAGVPYYIKDESGNALTNNITINTTAPETIDGVVSKVINTNYGSLKFYSDGISQWFIL